MSDLTQHQLNVLSTTERVGSCFSLAGIAFIFATFLLSPYYKKSINRQIFYASIGNLGVNIAALISEDGPARGQSSALCQLQGFLVQMWVVQVWGHTDLLTMLQVSWCRLLLVPLYGLQRLSRLLP